MEVGREKGEGRRQIIERKVIMCFAEYKNNYDHVIVCPTYTLCHLLYTPKRIRRASTCVVYQVMRVTSVYVILF